MKIIEEICNKYDGAKESVDNRIKELCVQDGILINEVHTRFKVNLFFCFEIRLANAVMCIVRPASSCFIILVYRVWSW